MATILVTDDASESFKARKSLYHRYLQSANLLAVVWLANTHDNYKNQSNDTDCPWKHERTQRDSSILENKKAEVLINSILPS